jgi:hypothetical protein
LLKHRFCPGSEIRFRQNLPRGSACPAKIAVLGNSCRVKWANSSTFQKRCRQKIAQIQGKSWFMAAQPKVNKYYQSRSSANEGGGAKAPPRTQARAGVR